MDCACCEAVVSTCRNGVIVNALSAVRETIIKLEELDPLMRWQISATAKSAEVNLEPQECWGDKTVDTRLSFPRDEEATTRNTSTRSWTLTPMGVRVHDLVEVFLVVASSSLGKESLVSTVLSPQHSWGSRFTSALLAVAEICHLIRGSSSSSLIIVSRTADKALTITPFRQVLTTASQQAQSMILAAELSISTHCHKK